MSTTDARAGFRLPWSAEQPEGDAPATTGDTAPGPAPVDPWGGQAAAAAAPGRRTPNRLMADLARAMQAAAEATRDETLARLKADARTVVEGIQAGSGSESAELRQRADQDVAGIRDWSKAEIARIRETTEQRIAERRAGLDAELERHAARVEQRIERVQARVEAFEAEMALFFETLLAEEDPGRLAALAERLPEPPTFDAIVADDPGSTGSPATDAGAPGAPETLSPAEAAAAEAEAEASARPADDTAAEPAADGPSTDDVMARLGLLPAAGVDGTSESGTEPRTSRVIVTGLVSVASIAGFKRQLAGLAGVASVGVSSGPDGEFVFAVAHDPELALRDILPTLPGFDARVTEATDDSISVAAHDPETAA